VSVEHQPFKDFMAFRTKLGDFKQKPVAIGLVRDGKPVDVTVTPDAKGLIGFKPSVGDERRPVTGPVEAVTMATTQQLETTSMLCSALYQLFTSPGSMMDKTGGPVQIVAMGDQIYQDDPWKLLTFAVLLSIELAIINLLPLPALDGGHLVLLFLEKLRGRALPRRVEERILVFGFVMIMGLGMLLIVKDILTVPSMYHQVPAPATSPSR
jgi:RIP metalloprotease RseP